MSWLCVVNLTNRSLLAAISALIQKILFLNLLNPELIRGSLKSIYQFKAEYFFFNKENES